MQPARNSDLSFQQRLAVTAGAVVAAVSFAAAPAAAQSQSDTTAHAATDSAAAQPSGQNDGMRIQMQGPGGKPVPMQINGTQFQFVTGSMSGSVEQKPAASPQINTVPDSAAADSAKAKAAVDSTAKPSK
jgi:hypothetical protein